MTDRYVGDGKRFTKIGDPANYKVGDWVFFSTANHTVAGEGMFIGRLKAAPEILVLVVGQQVVETEAKHCARVGGGRPAEGASWRGVYLKQRPGTLAS